MSPRQNPLWVSLAVRQAIPHMMILSLTAVAQLSGEKQGQLSCTVTSGIALPLAIGLEWLKEEGSFLPLSMPPYDRWGVWTNLSCSCSQNLCTAPLKQGHLWCFAQDAGPTLWVLHLHLACCKWHGRRRLSGQKAHSHSLRSLTHFAANRVSTTVLPR